MNCEISGFHVKFFNMEFPCQVINCNLDCTQNILGFFILLYVLELSAHLKYGSKGPKSRFVMSLVPKQ